MAVCSDIDPSPSLAGLHHLGIAVFLRFILEAGRYRDGSTALTGAIEAVVKTNCYFRIFGVLAAMAVALVLAGGTALAVVPTGDTTTTTQEKTTQQDATTSSGAHTEAAVQQLAAAWGRNDFGQLGNSTSGTSTNSNKPVAVGGGLSAPDIKALAGGTSHSLALKNDGTVWAWGRNDVGELGNGTFTTTGCNCINTPVQVKDPSDPNGGFLQNVKAIAAGGDHSLALKNDGSVVAWGFNGLGQLGNGNTGTNSNTPVQVVDPTDPQNTGFLTNVTAIAAGADYSLALKGDQTVRSWGSNNAGQLGNGNTGTNSNTPVQVKDPSDPSTFLQGVKAIAGGGVHSLALKTDGTVRSWGANNSGELGNGTTGGISNTPVTVSNLKGVTAISAGGNYSLALKKTMKGTVVRAWGSNNSGQLGNVAAGNNSNVPIAVSNLKNVKAIAAGGDFGQGNHSLALKTDGTVSSWGANDSGQLGNGNTGTNSNVPVKVSNLSGAAAIDSGGYHSLAK